MSSGSLIVFEGVDEVGKSTLSHRLVQQMEELSLPVRWLSFPGREPGSVGSEIYDIHHRTTELSPSSLQMLHIAAHCDCIERQILPLLKSGTHIVLDRYWWSTWVYGICAGVPETLLKQMINLEQAIWNGVLPKVMFLIERENPSEDVAVKSRISEYRRLHQKEAERQQAEIITNNQSVEAALKKIVDRLAVMSPKDFHGLKVSRNAKLKQRSKFSSLAPAITTPVFESYWRLAVERQEIFFRRLEGKEPPWSENPIFQTYKFTNAYRASDRVSQYLIQNVIYQGDQSPKEVFFRTILFKLFNRIETWELLYSSLGGVSYRDYRFERYNQILNKAIESGQRVYSAAYIMPSGGRHSEGGRKHTMHLRLLEKMMRDDLPKQIAQCSSMGKAFELIRSYPTIGDFLAYQYITDLNYSKLTNFSEIEFVVAGPGALSGIQKCFKSTGGLTESEIIKRVTECQSEEFERLGLSFRSLWGRPLQLIDCQNLFCEVDKYARVAHPEYNGPKGRTRIKQKFRPTAELPQPWYPPKWGINDQINAGKT